MPGTIGVRSPQVTLLLRAGLVTRRLTSADIRTLNRLTTGEVRALISIGRKVGRGSKVKGFFIF